MAGDDEQWVHALHEGNLDVVGAEEWAPAVTCFAYLFGQAAAPDLNPSANPNARTQQHVALVHAHAASMGALSRPAAPSDVSHPDRDGWTHAARQLLAFLHNEPATPVVELSRDRALRVEQMCVRALQGLAAGELDVATQHARRATRAAYAESLRGQEYLAYWVLGRVRRSTGNLYAATRIFAALARATPPAWRPLMEWELVLAGGDLPGQELSEPANTWRSLCAATLNGDRATWVDAQQKLAGAVLPPRLALERDALLGGLEGTLNVAAHRAVAGALYESALQIGKTPAVWRLSPGAAPRLQWCVAAPLEDEESVLFDEGDRVRTAAAVLAEAGDAGAPIETLFRSVYGFDFDQRVHDGIFRVLLHRVREAMGDRAEIEREGPRITLRAGAAIALPEPRSEPPFGDRLLRLIATDPGATAKDLADRSGIPLRGVQRALRLLIDTGACRADRKGRRIVYAVEDTTFSEPTHFGQRP
ncbi:MAG: winged helix-turn-helix domain-containing protein [Myxococcota bacterium]